MSSTAESHAATATNNKSAQESQDASASTSVEDNSGDVRPESTQELNISTDDPFQEKRHEKASERENDESLQNVLPPELADQLLKKFSTNEITIESRTLFVQDSHETEICRDNLKTR
ncbi:hypothetical protein AAVH_00484 [Aphelenchoides avenae]|nr:hypothetical protein AAVH_00484 [Aphelenchus avenae]